MSKSLEQILGFAPLTESLKATTSGVPNPLPQEFFTVNPANRVLGDRAKYIRVTGERRTSQRNQYGAPAKRRALRDVSDQTVRMLHNFESIQIDLLTLQKLQAFEQYKQDEGMDWLRYQVEEAAHRQQNARVVAVASALRHGALYWDASGNLLPSSSGADSNLTIDLGVPATHKNQINGILDASWALANTDIPGHLRGIKQYAAQETGLVPTVALYGINVPRYLTQNEYVMSYLARGDARDKFLATGEIPDGLFDLSWKPVYTMFFEDADGTNQELWGDDAVTLIPDLPQPDKMGWWAMYEGSFPVPKTLDVQRDPMGTMTNYELLYGMFSYGVMSHNPPGAEVFFGDVFLPAFKSEKAVWQLDVTP